MYVTLHSSTCFEQRAVHHQEEQLYHHSLWYRHSTDSRTVCGWRANCSPLSTRILYGCLQRVTIPEAVVIQLVHLMMSSVLLETC